MTAKEKAKELIEKFEPFVDYTECDVFTQRENMLKNAKQCALIAVDEIMKSNPCVIETINFEGKQGWVGNSGYFEDVKFEIENYEN